MLEIHTPFVNVLAFSEVFLRIMLALKQSGPGNNFSGLWHPLLAFLLE